jgi:hypothetical protein
VVNQPQNDNTDPVIRTRSRSILTDVYYVRSQIANVHSPTIIAGIRAGILSNKCDRDVVEFRFRLPRTLENLVDCTCLRFRL